MIQAGLYAAGSDKAIDAAMACYPALDNFLTIKDQRGTLAHFAKLRQAIAGGVGEMKPTFGDPGPRG
jgi:flagellum-specific ATP synthase